LCGAAFVRSRNKALPEPVSTITLTPGVALMASSVAWIPPEYTKIPPSGADRSGSMIRPDRIGPTTGGRLELKTAMNRVMPYSTICS